MKDLLAKLEEELAEAERDLADSRAALLTHGHQSVTWMFLKADAERVAALRARALMGGGK